MIQKPRGTEDLVDKKVKEFFALELILRNIADLYNYREIRTPYFESADLFLRSVGQDTDIVSKEMYIFNDKKNRQLALRPEGTAPTVRSILENKMYINENLPLKLFYFGSMFRYERPQNGRQRQFNTFGVEMFGPKSPEADSETICLAVHVLKTIGIENFNVHLNYLVGEEQRKIYIKDLKDQLSSFELCDDCKERLEKNPLRVLDCKVDQDKFKNIKDMKEYLSDEDKKYYNDLKINLKNIDIKIIENKNLVRGLDYYTGFVFEIKDNNDLTLIGGGRYDKLVNELGNVDLPAAGWGMGVERIILSLEKQNIFLSEENYLDAYIVTLSSKSKQFANILMLMLRSAGLKVDGDFMNRSMKSAFKQAEKNNSKNIIIIGDNELKENNVVIKNQQTKDEKKVLFQDIVDYLMKGN
ncbi:histidine--tRNA ligase [Spiroplasma tabanidicola]|uniref:Histidine--tRNA ligase n=1 Tax=Spiroplasma tabanidicola TaxID=324079 RepID=A0A6I6CIK8_9MOLU|nr:histidine--tRNA ligase [Spiroplasma tabanidicola]QGS51893.1 histidyl-tRNA synthetase [Spiroplasma tabanidicola]